MLPAAALVLAAAASLTGAPPAAAAVTGTVGAGDVVLYDHCQQHPISYDLAVSPFTPAWRVNIRVYTPNGRTSEGTVINSASDPALSGTTTYTFCGSEQPGTWTVKAFVRYAPVDLTPDTLLTESTFQVVAPATRTRLHTKSLGQGRHRLVTRVAEQTENGYEPAEGVRVRLEKRTGGTWKRVPEVVLTTVHGRAVTTVTGRGTYRALVPARNNLGGSSSPTVALG